MKRLLLLLALAAFTFTACEKDKTGPDSSGNNSGNGGNHGDVVQISEIIVDTEYALIVDTGQQLIAIHLNPDGASLKDNIDVSGGDDKIITWSLSNDGLLVTPIHSGQTSLTLSAKNGPASDKTVNISVINEIGSFKVKFSAAGATPFKYDDSPVYHLSMGKKYFLQAYLTDIYGNDMTTAVNWEVGDGLSVNGIELTVTDSGKSSFVKAILPADKSKTASVDVKTYAAPTGITFKNPDSLIELKKDEIKYLYFSVEPSDALQEIKVSSPEGFEVTKYKTLSSEYSHCITVKATSASSSKDPYKVTVSSAVSAMTTAVRDIYVVDYLADDVKAGDYVYYNSTTKKYRFSDCGKRYFSYGYSDTVVPPAPESNETYLGVIVTVYDSFPENVPSTIPGLSNAPGKHVLVWCKNERSTTWDSSSSYKTERLDASISGPYNRTKYLKENYPNLDIVKALGYFTIGTGGNSTGWCIYSGDYGVRDLFPSFDNSLTAPLKPQDFKYKYYWSAADDSYGYVFCTKIDENGAIETNRSWAKNQENQYLDGKLFCVCYLRPAMFI